MNTSETLHKAADLIEERGWTKGVNGWPDADRDGAPLCLEGGIMAAQGLLFGGSKAQDAFEMCPAYIAVQDFLGERRIGSTVDKRLCRWNDKVARNAAEVTEVLRATAAVEELREAEARGPLDEDRDPVIFVPEPRMAVEA